MPKPRKPPTQLVAPTPPTEDLKTPAEIKQAKQHAKPSQSPNNVNKSTTPAQPSDVKRKRDSPEPTRADQSRQPGPSNHSGNHPSNHPLPKRPQVPMQAPPANKRQKKESSIFMPNKVCHNWIPSNMLLTLPKAPRSRSITWTSSQPP
jgi:hypothetical protein